MNRDQTTDLPLLLAHDPSLAFATLRDLDYLQRQVSDLEARLVRMEETLLAHTEPVFPQGGRETYMDHTRRDDATR
jgi:hypothetical protein